MIVPVRAPGAITTPGRGGVGDSPQRPAVALVAADHPETARRALSGIRVDYEVLEPVTDPVRAAFDPECPPVRPGGNLVRHQPVRAGDVAAARARADVVVAGEYEVGIQDQ